ncbi:MAG: hypothetical protein KME21_29150 [Desmonostoc vinosum HA7617-LM4]|jgi:CII-binding regulator of phage lambda lysogenization HflD|nr:hypothetical protein [Desmonostoc vinosum HA7617-LM4]
MTVQLSNYSLKRKSALMQPQQQIEQLQSRIRELEKQHQDYKRSQKKLIGAIAEICISPMQEIEALRILIYRGEAECRRYLRSLLKNQNRAS